MTSSDLIRDVHRAEWRLDRVYGSHHVYKYPDRPEIVVGPHSKKDLELESGLVKVVRNQAGVQKAHLCVISSPSNPKLI